VVRLEGTLHRQAEVFALKKRRLVKNLKKYFQQHNLRKLRFTCHDRSKFFKNTFLGGVEKVILGSQTRIRIKLKIHIHSKPGIFAKNLKTIQ
jgi:hypothetical protein